jgi:alpha-mannosidase
VYLLAASVDGDQSATFRIGDRSVTQKIQDWGGYIGQWDNRLWSREVPETSQEVDADWSGLTPGYVKRDTVAWFCSHRHHPQNGNEFYHYSYLFKYGFDVPPDATSITLPDNEKVRIFAVTVAKNAHDATVAARPLYDTLEDHGGEPPMASVSPNGGTFNDITQVTLHHALYWTAGRLHYTLDGSEPTAQSPAYDDKPIKLWSSTIVRAREFDASGKPGAETTAQFNVNDTTAPTVKAISAVAMLPTMRIDFSEPLRKSDAETAANYRLDPSMPVQSAKLSEDGTSVTLQLAKPLSAKEDGGDVRISFVNVRDASPAGNEVGAQPLPVALARPLFSLDSIICNGESKEQPVKGLPMKAKDAWSINLFVKTDKQPDNRTIIAGFGQARDDHDGAGRYLCKFGDGVHFWSRVRDVGGRRTELDVGKWQMLTATYDGESLKLYKNGQRIARRNVELSDDDESVVRIAPLDPWDQQRRFRGEIRNFTIWNTALPPEALKVLLDAGPGNSPATQPADQSASGAGQ